jgi:branched-chain amino acid transport system substrate-binding protein
MSGGKWLGTALSLILAAIAPGARAETPIKIGVLTDMSSVYSNISGPGAVTAVQMAVDDFGGSVLGRPIEVVAADMRNNAAIGSTIAREWYDTGGVEVITSLDNSAVAEAVVDVAAARKKIALVVGAASPELTNARCSPYSVHYSFDTTAWANVLGTAIVKQGGTLWYFLTTDYSFGHVLEADTTRVITKLGGKVVGHSVVPLDTPDMSSFLVSAMQSGAKVLGLANSGTDTINAVKEANEFGLVQKGMLIALLGGYISDVHSIGLDIAQGLMLPEGWYWDRTDTTRAWAKRFFAKMGRMPTVVQAGDYSATLHYLQAVAAAKSLDGVAIMENMRQAPINDMFATNGIIRPDGLMVHDMYLVEVKKPSESRYPWDYYTIRATVPGSVAFQPLSESTCPFLKKQ